MRASPRSYARFTELPPGAIQPEGWLRQYTRINADGWLLRYAQMRDPELYSIFWDRVASLEGYWDSSCDFAGYFADGLIRYAQLVPESDLATELDEWLGRLLASQDPDGYLGPFEPDARNTQILEAFTIGILVEALLQRYEFTADPEILSASERAMRALMKHWRAGDERSDVRSYLLHGTYVIRAATQLYKLTGKQDFLTYAREVLDRFGRVEHYLRYYPECEIRDQRRKRGWIAPAPEDEFAPPPHFRHQYDQTDFLGFSASSIADGYNACSGRHNVCESEDVGLPAILYEYSGDEELLRASEAAWTMMQAHLSPHGSPLGNELLHHRGPRASTEHCGAVEWMLTNQALTRITGAVKYADAAERAFFNAYPAAKSTDGQLIAYLHAANQLVASEWTFPPWNDPDKGWSSHFYSTAHDPMCCNANGPRAIPHFIGGMAMAEPGGLVVLHFGPCTIKADLPDAGQVELRQETAYPFEDHIRITVNEAPRNALSLGLRIPGWSASARIAINGVRWDGVANPGHNRPHRPRLAPRRSAGRAFRGPDSPGRPSGDRASRRRRRRSARPPPLRSPGRRGLAALRGRPCLGTRRSAQLSAPPQAKFALAGGAGTGSGRSRFVVHLRQSPGARRLQSLGHRPRADRPAGQGANRPQLAARRRPRPSRYPRTSLQTDGPLGAHHHRHAAALRLHPPAPRLPALGEEPPELGAAPGRAGFRTTARACGGQLLEATSGKATATSRPVRADSQQASLTRSTSSPPSPLE